MPQPNRFTKTEDDGMHIHNWHTKDFVEEYCTASYYGNPCKAIKIGTNEYSRRKSEWDNYFEMVRTTDSYRDYQEMKEAYVTRNFPKMAEIRERIAKRMKISQTKTDDWGEPIVEFDEDHYLPKPHFPDPESTFPYVVEGR